MRRYSASSEENSTPSPSASNPFRAQLKVADEEAIRHANKSENRVGEDLYQAAEDEIARLEEFSRREISPRTIEESRTFLERCVTHPDERVPRALLASRLHCKKGAEEISLQLYVHALDEANKEGARWTPLLDSVAHHDGWDGGDLRRQGGQAHEILLKGQIRQIPNGLAMDRVNSASHWLSQQTKEEEILSLSIFESSDFHNVLARSTGTITPQIIDTFFADPSSWVPLTRNPAFGEEALSEICLRLSPLLQGSFKRSLMPALWAVDSAVSIYGVQMPSSSVEEILDWLERLDQIRMSKADIDVSGLAETSAVDALAASPNISPSQMWRLYVLVRDRRLGTRRIGELIRRSDVPEEIFHDAFKNKFRSSEIRKSLAANHRSAAIPEIRQAFKSSQSTEVLIPLLRSASSKEVSELFRKVSKLAPHEAVKFLSEMSDEQLQNLSQGDLLHLLSSEDQNIRLSAIRTAAKVRPDTKGVRLPRKRSR